MTQATEMRGEDIRTDDREAGVLPNQPNLFRFIPIVENVEPPRFVHQHPKSKLPF